MRVTAGVIIVIVLARAIEAIGNIIILLLVSFVLAVGFQPAVTWLEQRGVKRGWAVAIIFATGFFVVAAFLGLVVPIIVREVSNLVEEAPNYLREAQAGSGFIGNLNERFDLEAKLRDLSQELPTTALSLIRSFTAFLFNTVTVVILTLYFTAAMPQLRAGVARLLHWEDRRDFLEILDESTQRVGGYVLGNIAVSAIAGILSFLVLVVVGVPFAAALAFWVALTDLVPTIGAILGAAAAALVAAFTGVTELIITAAYFLMYQQVENYLIAPRIMKRAIDMSAAVVIVAVLIGASLAGVVGALLALPVAAVIKIVVRELYLEPRIEVVKASEKK
ncbi:MAG: AI-2E family transporter [Actinomycetota bacterium]